jgi:hypothetical protein
MLLDIVAKSLYSEREVSECSALLLTPRTSVACNISGISQLVYKGADSWGQARKKSESIVYRWEMGHAVA